MSQIKGKWLKDGSISEQKIADGAVSNQKIENGTIGDEKLVNSYLKTDGTNQANADLNIGGFKLTNIGSATNPNDAVTKSQLDAVKMGFDVQKRDVLNHQIDDTLDPGSSPQTGDRYIIGDASNLHANFGTISNLEDNDIVEYNGSEFFVQYDVSIIGTGGLVYVRTGRYESYDGTAWNEFGGLSGVTAGNGLTKNGNILDVGTGNGIEVLPDNINAKGDITKGISVDNNGIGVKVDNSTIDFDGSGNVIIPDGGVTNDKLAGGISDDKLNTITSSNSVSGSAIQLATNSGLEDATGLKIKLENSNPTIQVNGSNEVGVKVGNGFIVDANGLNVDPSYSEKTNKEKFTLSDIDIANKSVTLEHQPLVAANTRCHVKGGGIQDYGVDFSVSGTTLTWDIVGSDMLALLEEGEKIIIIYSYA